jgi:hypothetical protein
MSAINTSEICDIRTDKKDQEYVVPIYFLNFMSSNAAGDLGETKKLIIKDDRIEIHLYRSDGKLKLKCE